MTINKSCPQRETLTKLIEGSLTEHQEDELINHLDQCSVCREAMEQLSSTTAGHVEWSDLREPNSGSPFLTDAMHKARSLRSPWSVPDDTGSQPTFGDISNFRPDGFTQIEEIGRGGMGIVFKAHEESLDRWVAIKVLAPTFAADKSARERFLREARAAASIKASSVVAIHAVSNGLPLPYLVMELVEGKSLQQFLDEGKRFDANEVLKVARCVTDGLQAAHAKGIVHRDIKPANLLIDVNSGNALVSDFGLAQVANRSRLTQTGILVGTPAYIAPELLEDNAGGDARSDLFSLGCVLYAMCSGASPFDSDTAVKTLHKIGTLDPPPVQSHNATIPKRLASIVDRLVLKDPSQRFQTAKALASALSETNQASKPSFSLVTDDRSSRNTGSSRRSKSQMRLHAKHGWILGGALALIFALTLIVISQGAGDKTTASSNSVSKAAFVVTDSDARTVASFETLGEAIGAAPDGATIDINTNAEIYLEPIEIDQTDLTIAATEGFKPVFQFNGDEAEDGFLTANGNLRLDGIDVRAIWTTDDPEGQPLVTVRDGSFEAENCRFQNSSEGTCFLGDGMDQANFSNCKLVSTNGAAIDFEPAINGTLTITNCQIFGGTSIHFHAEHDGAIEMQRCTLIGDRLVELWIEEVDEDDLPFVSVDAAGCLLAAQESVLSIDSESWEQNRFLEAIKWTGKKNLFSGAFIESDDESDSNETQDDSGLQIETMAQWQENFDELQSRQIDEPFEIEIEEIGERVFEDPSFDVSKLPLHASILHLGVSYGAQ